MTSENVSFLEKRRVLQQQIENGGYRTVYFILLDGTGRLIRRLTRAARPISFWFSALVLCLLQLLLTALLPLILGEAALYRVAHHGISPIQLVGGIILEFLIGPITIMIFVGRFQELFHTLIPQLLDKVTSEADLADIQSWLSAANDVRRPLLWGLVYTLVIAPYNTFSLSSFMNSSIGIGGVFIQVLTCFSSGIGLYYLFLMFSFHARIQNYHFQLYPLDPSSSEVIHILSRILSGNEYVLAFILALGTLVFGFIGVMSVYGPVIVLVGWIPVLVIFILHYLSIDKIIRQAKRDTLYDLQSQIEGLLIRETPPTKETLEHVNKLMDFYDRVKNTNTSAINLRAGLSLINSLILPLLAFVFSNLQLITTLLGPLFKII